MKEYELIHEIYNTCDGSPTSSIREIQTDDLDAYIKTLISTASKFEKQITEDGVVIYEVMTNMIKERYTFSEL